MQRMFKAIFCDICRRVAFQEQLEGGFQDKVINGKAKPEYVGPKLKEYTCDILLDAAHGVNPRKMLKRLTQMAEDGEVHYFIIGFAPLSENRFRITDVSESWDAVIKHGLLVQCKVSLTIKEYV